MCSPSDHIRLKRDSQFPKLALVGVQRFPGQPAYELRNCAECHSTLAKQVEDEDETV